MTIKNRQLLLALSIALLTGCAASESIKGSEKHQSRKPRTKHANPIDFPDVAKETDIDRLLRGMTSANCFLGGSVGESGFLPRQYACFERLSELLTDREMYLLSKHQDPVIRAYAYLGLNQKKSPYLPAARKVLSVDSTLVCVQAGCLILEEPLAHFTTWHQKED